MGKSEGVFPYKYKYGFLFNKIFRRENPVGLYKKSALGTMRKEPGGCRSRGYKG